LNTRTTTWEIPPGNTVITQNYIQANMPPGITRVIIPEGVTSIGHGAFIGCTGLMQITLPAGVMSIGPYAFKGCNGLTHIYLPAGLTSIYDCAFQYCTGITEIHFSERSQLTSIGEDAFYGCRGLMQIHLPAGLKNIGDDAFRGCIGLTQVSLPESLTHIKAGAFRFCTGLTQMVIPEGVTSIGDRAFFGCTGLNQIVIPEALTSIESYAFDGCIGLTQIHLPAGVTHIGHSAFAYCTSLTQMILPDPFCTDDEKVKLGIPTRVRCIQYSHIISFINDVLTIKGSYSVDKQALLYRLSSHWLVHPDQLKALEDCGFNDVMKAIKYRYSQQVDGDIRGLNGFFGRPRNDQEGEVDQLIKLNFAQILSAIPEDLTSALLSHMTVKDGMNYYRCKRGEPGLLSLKQRPEKGGHFEKAKTTAKNICKFLGNSTYRSAILGMNDSAIMKSAFDKKAMGLIIVGLASAVAYARMSSPLRLLAVAALPIAFTSKAYPYASEYLTKGVEAFKDANPVRLEQADQANAMDLPDGIANQSAAAANGDESGHRSPTLGNFSDTDE
ncbi:leucine-rich repeat domain-containing protein, partial [Gammaproteobacteria bacterium]|nr:leucine-rich repeat domain-containing protein [Gammaproteobacteria bacterium]